MPALPSSFSHRLAAGVFAGRGLCLLGGALAVCASVPFASGQQADTGPGRSPFLPQGWEQQAQGATARPATGDTPQGSYIFNGMIEIGGRRLFSVSNAESGHAMLLELGGKSGDVEVLSYDPQRNSVSLSNAGRTEELALRKSDGEPLAVAVNATGGGQRGGPGMQGRQPGQGGGAGGSGQARGGPPVAWLEARRNRLNEQIEQRRAEELASGGGAVTVGGGSAAPANANNAGGTRASGATMQGGGQSQGDPNSQGVRGRRLRMQMNPN